MPLDTKMAAGRTESDLDHALSNTDRDGGVAGGAQGAGGLYAGTGVRVGVKRRGKRRTARSRGQGAIGEREIVLGSARGTTTR